MALKNFKVKRTERGAISDFIETHHYSQKNTESYFIEATLRMMKNDVGRREISRLPPFFFYREEHL